MPQIPSLTPQESQLAPQSGVRVSQDAPLSPFGGGGAVEQVDHDVHRLAQINTQAIMDEQERADQLRILDAATKLSEGQNSILLGVKQRQGENAFGAYDDASKSWKTMTTEIEKGLSNDYQKAAFRLMQQKRKVDIDGEINSHVVRQSEVFDNEKSAAYIKAEGQSAIENMSNPALIDKAINNQQAALAGLGRRNGAPAEKIQLLQAQTGSETRLAVLKRMLENGNDLVGRQFYETNKAGFYGEDKTTAEKWLQVKSTLGEAQRLSDAAFNLKDAGSELDGFGVKNTKELQDASLKIDDPQVRHEFLRLGHERLADYDRAEKEQYAKDAQDAFEVVESTGSLDAIPLDIRQRLKPSAINQLEARARDLHRKAEPVTVWEEYTKLKDLAADPSTRQKFLEIPAMNYRNYLSNTEFKEVLNIREGLVKGDDKTIAKMKGYRSVSDIVNGTLSTWISKGDSPFGDDKDARETLERMMDEEVKTFQSKNHGEMPESEWVQDKIDKLITNATIEPGFLFDKKEFGYESTANYLNSVEKIPEDERRLIEASLLKHGQKPTRRRIIELFTEKRNQSHPIEPTSRAQFLLGGK